MRTISVFGLLLVLLVLPGFSCSQSESDIGSVDDTPVMDGGNDSGDSGDSGFEMENETSVPDDE